jgi:hypothetical protein
MNYLKSEIKKTIGYFSNFNYAPTASEIHTYLRLRVGQSRLDQMLDAMVKDREIVKKTSKIAKFAGLDTNLRIITSQDSVNRYTLRGYSHQFKIQNSKSKITIQKLKRIEGYLKLISRFPQVKLIGLSGSAAMFNAGRNDDIDLFIISDRNRIWTARFIVNIIGSLYSLKRKRGVASAPDKICLNLFFDQKSIKVPRFKQNEYVAHEILQMKPLYIANDTYKRFLAANKWVFKLFPNSTRSIPNFFDSVGPPKGSSQVAKKLVSSLASIIEFLLKKLQLALINRHKTTEIITDSQLWFFPDDFEKKIK